MPQYFQYKVWVKPSAEMSFLYGNHVLKSGLGRITENTPQYVLYLFAQVVANSKLRYQGVVVMSMSDIPLGAFCCETVELKSVRVPHPSKYPYNRVWDHSEVYARMQKAGTDSNCLLPPSRYWRIFAK